MKKSITRLVAIIACFILTVCCFTGCNEQPSEKTSLTKADYIQVFDSMKASYNSYIANSSTQSLSVTIDESDYIDATGNDTAESTVNATFAMLYFLKKVLNRSDYVLKDGADDCYMFNPIQDDAYDVRMLFDYDKDSKLINVKMCAYENDADVNYLDYEIKYDFTSNKLDYFILSFFYADKATMTPIISALYRYQNGSLSELSQESSKYAQFCENLLNDTIAFIEPARETSPEDYSEEYNSAMTEAWA